MLPLVVPPLDDERHAAAVAAAVDGLLMTGGEDVEPARYGATPHPATDAPHGPRDRSEIALVIAARTLALPTLAICRGLQIVNVAFGGTLVQDLPSERPEALDHAPGGPRDRRAHPVTVRSGSRLANALGATELSVNSSHHQALDAIASEIVVTATAPDGVVEGAESAGERWWMLGVQWHPEELTETPDHWDRALFEAFHEGILARTAREAHTVLAPASRGTTESVARR